MQKINTKFTSLFLLLLNVQNIFSMQREIECSSSSSLQCFEATGSLFEIKNRECFICLENRIEEKFEVLECEHSFCLRCLIQMVEIAVREKNLSQLKCPNTECSREITMDDIQRILDRDKKTKLEEYNALMTKEHLAKDPDVKWCQSPNCQFIFINDENILQTIQCPECEQKYCSMCLIKHSMETTCDEAKIKGKQRKEEIMSEEWKLAETSKCPNCPVTVRKESGCSSVKCEVCRHKFCWNCLGPYYEVYHECNRSEAIKREQAKKTFVQEHIASVSRASSSSSGASSTNITNQNQVDRYLTDDRYLALWNSARYGRTENVRRLLQDQLIDVNSRNSSGNTVLKEAIIWDRIDVIRVLLQDQRTDVNVRDNFGWTVLIYASFKGNEEAVRMLLQVQAPRIDVNARNHDGKTALYFARSYGHKNIVELLEADPRTIDCEGSKYSFLRYLLFQNPPAEYERCTIQ